MNLSKSKAARLWPIAVLLSLTLSSCQPTARTLVATEIEAAEAASEDEAAEGMEVAFAIVRNNRMPSGEYDADLATVADILDVAPRDISFSILDKYEFKTSPVMFVSTGTEVTVYSQGNPLGSFFIVED
ncbi:MAG: hypothetical protein AAF716_20165 [Cyanobacteria bacterium P01_D01_bin.1]